MKKILSLALLACALPAVAPAASLNLATAVGSINKGLGLTGTHAAPVAALQAPCFGQGCTDPATCPTSPENPTVLLAVLGATGLLLGRLGYGRVRNRRELALTTAA